MRKQYICYSERRVRSASFLCSQVQAWKFSVNDRDNVNEWYWNIHPSEEVK